MTDLFQFAARAAQLRDAGMKLAVTAQDAKVPEWSEIAFAAIKRIAQRQAEVHVDHVLREFRLKPSHANAWGAVWMRAIKENVIERTGTVRPCLVDPTKHKHNSPVYRSLILGSSGGDTGRGDAAPSVIPNFPTEEGGAAKPLTHSSNQRSVP